MPPRSTGIRDFAWIVDLFVFIRIIYKDKQFVDMCDDTFGNKCFLSISGRCVKALSYACRVIIIVMATVLSIRAK